MPDFNCWSNFALSWVDRVTTGTKSFVSVIVNLPSSVELVIIQADDYVKKRLTSPLINGISRVLQKYFNGTSILTSFALPSAGVLLVIFTLNLNDLESAKLLFGSSLYYCHKVPHFLNNCHYVLPNYALALLYQYLEHYLLPYSLF